MSARSAALAALDRCTREGAWSGSGIDNVIKKYSLDRRDAALASRLCLGVLQNLDYCDHYIALYYSRDISKLEIKLLNILRLGCYQLLFMDKIPPRAAVNETVSLCKESGYARASGLVNAVLRRISDNKENLPELPGKGQPEYLSLRYSHPLWLSQKLCEEKGYEFTQSFFAANNAVAPLFIQVNILKISPEEYACSLEEAGVVFEAADGLPGCFMLEGGNINTLPGYNEGHFYVQDKAARTAALISEAKPGMRVLDCCAAPGGKTFSTAISMENKGEIVSCDIHEKKLKLIKEGAERLAVNIVSTVARDAREPEPVYENAFDIVICDVPCSGLGVIRKRPEIRYKKPDEISTLPEIQKAIIENASSFVKPGGILLYSTCTVMKEENEDVVNWFLNNKPEFTHEEFSVGGISSLSGMYTFWPNVDGSDGFFAAKLRRIK